VYPQEDVTGQDHTNHKK